MKKLIFTSALVLIASIFGYFFKPATPVITTKILRYNIEREPATLDPRRGGDIVSSTLHFLLFDRLTRLGPDGTVSLSGAASVDISPDNRTYTFFLKPLNWSNGDPVTAYDYAYAWKSILDPSFPAPNAHLLYPILGAQQAKEGSLSLDSVGIFVVNPTTLIVQLETPTSYFLELLSFCIFSPISAKADSLNPKWALELNDAFVCNGPFKLSSWKRDDEIILNKNLNYHNQEIVKLDQLHLLMIGSESTALNMYEKGQIDVINLPITALSPEKRNALMESHALRSNPGAGTYFCAFNVNRPHLGNAHIRKALAYAIDRKSIVDNITQLGEAPALGAIPPTMKSRGARQFYTDCNVDLANQELNMGLSELGITRDDLSTLTFAYPNGGCNSKVVQAIQQQWKKNLGIHISLEALDHKHLMSKFIKRDYDIGYGLWVAQYYDPMNILERYAHKGNPKNYAGWANPAFSQLLEKSTLTVSSTLRTAILEEAEEVFTSDMPVAPVYHCNFSYLIGPRVDNILFSPMGGLYLEHLSIKETSF